MSNVPLTYHNNKGKKCKKKSKNLLSAHQTVLIIVFDTYKTGCMGP
jgi:hypothetical protein